MNKERRNKIAALVAQLEDIKGDLDTIANEEREGFDNMPEGLQASDAGQAKEAAADALDEAVSSFDDLLSNLETAVE